jgi:hypothetical protein
MLVDAQIRHQRRGLLQHRVRRGSERRMRHRPGDPGVPLPLLTPLTIADATLDSGAH